MVGTPFVPTPKAESRQQADCQSLPLTTRRHEVTRAHSVGMGRDRAVRRVCGGYDPFFAPAVELMHPQAHKRAGNGLSTSWRRANFVPIPPLAPFGEQNGGSVGFDGRVFGLSSAAREAPR